MTSRHNGTTLEQALAIGITAALAECVANWHAERAGTVGPAAQRKHLAKAKHYRGLAKQIRAANDNRGAAASEVA